MVPRDRRDSCMVVHNLLQPRNDDIVPLEEIRSALATPLPKLDEVTPLDSDSLSNLVVSVRDLSKSLSML